VLKLTEDSALFFVHGSFLLKFDKENKEPSFQSPGFLNRFIHHGLPKKVPRHAGPFRINA